MASTKRRRKAASGWEPFHVSEIAPHRQARLEAERERLERRLAWAEQRGEAAKAERLAAQLDDLDDAIDLPAEALEGSGRETTLRRRWGDEMADLMLGVAK